MSRSRYGALGAIGAALVLVVAFVLALGPAAPVGQAPLDPAINAPAPGGPAAPAGAEAPKHVGNGVFVGTDAKHDKSAKLRDMKLKPARPKLLDEGEEDGQEGADLAPVEGKDPVVQVVPSTATAPVSILSFDGIGFPGVNCNCAPPDTNGEVGDTQFVQSVNDGFQVFDKATGTALLPAATIGSIWTGFGGVCETSGAGDPVVLWDQLAGRWLVSQFAGGGTITDECIAISTTGDATGSWYRYGFHLGSNFYDYPHLAVWPDGYYMSDNVFNAAGTAYLGPQPFVFDRAKMLAGQAATFQTTAPLGSLVSPILPVDLEGSALPPAGAPASFVKFPDTGAYTTYHWKVDWATPTNTAWTTFGAPAAAGFTELCATTRSCVPQLGTADKLDGIGDRLMFRATYRNFGDHESVVGSYSVSSGGASGVRWFELRGVTSGPETVFQQGTYQPDTTWRWMPSAAMDKAGGIAVGYNASSSSINPQLRYAGRNAADPLGQLGSGEGTLIAGTGSQTGTSNRWGDYADLTVDPVDGCTFWFTGEYYSTTTSFGWRTRIGTFQLSGCTGAPPTTGSIAGHVTDATSSVAIGGATVTISGGPSTTTDAGGAYTFSSLDPAGYTLTASKAGYTSSAPQAVMVIAGATSPADFTLAPIPIVTTPLTYPTAYAAVTSGAGDNNGYEGSPANLLAGGGGFATDASSGTGNGTSCTSAARDKEVLSGYGLSIPAGAAVTGIAVQLSGYASSAKSTPRFCVQLSWDGGVTWTAGKSTASLRTTNTAYTLGSTADTWGRAWTPADFGTTKLRVRVTDTANSTARTFSLDSVAVQVTYQ